MRTNWTAGRSSRRSWWRRASASRSTASVPALPPPPSCPLSPSDLSPPSPLPCPSPVQLRREEERRRAAAQPVVVKGLDKLLGRDVPSAEESKEDTAASTPPHPSDSSPASSRAPAAPSNPLSDHIVDAATNLRVWLEEPPGLRRPPYMPAFTRQRPPGVHPDIPLIAPSHQPRPPPSHSPLPPSSLPMPPPPSHSPASQAAPRPVDSLPPPRPPPPPQPPSYAAPHPPRPQPPPSYSVQSSSSSPEIDPLDPNPDTALDRWKRDQARQTGHSRQRPPHASAPGPAPPPAPRAIPRPAFTPTHLLVNRPKAAVAPPPANVSRPASAAVKAAPAVSAAAGAAPRSAVVRSRAEVEYEALMRGLEEEGAL